MLIIFFQITLFRPHHYQILIQPIMKEIMSRKINLYCRKFTLLGYFMLLCLSGISQYNFNELEQLLINNKKVMGDGLVVLIYKDGKPVYQKELGEEFKLKTKVPVASCSKWLTAALVMTFVDEGIISLDDKVSKYLPIFEEYGRKYITIRQCLSHETGIADNEKRVVKILEFQKQKFESLEAQVNSFAKKEVTANPGTTFNYGNVGLNIAGRVLEVISKKRFEVLIKQRLFTPLNMRNSSFTPEENSTNPSGGAVSTATDYMNFLLMILDKGMFTGKRILSEAAINEMQTIQTKNIKKEFVPRVAEGFEYGLGEWVTETDASGKSNVVASPGLLGTWPYVDKCRNYACIFLAKKLLGEEKKEFYLELKRAIDKQMGPKCN